MLRIATRGSALARWQAEEVGRLLVAAHPGTEVELIVVSTTGDRRLDLPVWALGGQGVFAKEVQAAVLAGEADIAVHSAKDLPSTTASGLILAAIPRRGDPRDCLVGRALDDLAPGALVATGSVRRRAQLAWMRPDLTFTSLRGNIAARLAKVPTGGAIVVAAAALERLGKSGDAAQVLDPATMVPQVGQGAIGVECREDDRVTAELLGVIDDPVSRREVTCERAFLARLAAGSEPTQRSLGCDLPVGAHAVAAPGAVASPRADVPPDAVASPNASPDPFPPGGGAPNPHSLLAVEGVLASPDGRVLMRERAAGDPRGLAEAAALGARLAERLLAAGGDGLLAMGPSGAVSGGLGPSGAVSGGLAPTGFLGRGPKGSEAAWR
ncbi:MAG TPA: hydroxymethylbilane synthase [Acidimicrobiales bacterium]|nr:hydroxymethylbilane synthase [Acidimicrobiales bacterium]